MGDRMMTEWKGGLNGLGCGKCGKVCGYLLGRGDDDDELSLTMMVK